MANRTVLYEEHVKLGGQIVDFAGWELPVQYTRVIEEHETTRERAGVFDICHMGEVAVTGAGAFGFLQYVLSRDLSQLEPGRCMYSTMLRPDGGTVDDLFVYMLTADNFMLVVNAANIQKDIDWILGQSKDRADVEIADISAETAKIDLQGPETAAIMKKLCSAPLPARFRFIVAQVAGAETLLSRTGYTGEDGFELYCKNEYAVNLWRSILEAGKENGLLPCGLGARDSLRLEAGYSLYGHELADDVSPVEAGIAFAVAREKDYVGAEAVKRQLEGGAPRETVAFELLTRGVPRDHYEVERGGVKIGTVTSGTFSPTLKKGIGLARIDRGAASIGDMISVIIRSKPYEAKVVKRPFAAYRGGRA